MTPQISPAFRAIGTLLSLKSVNIWDRPPLPSLRSQLSDSLLAFETAFTGGKLGIYAIIAMRCQEQKASRNARSARVVAAEQSRRLGAHAECMGRFPTHNPGPKTEPFVFAPRRLSDN